MKGAIASLLIAGWVTSISAATPVPDVVQQWTSDHAVALTEQSASDLSALKSIVGGARVVGLGEGLHGTHEFLSLRNQVFEYLVTELGFTAIAAESDFVDGTAINDYVIGGGPLTPEVIAGVFSFTAPATPLENRELLEWMRAHNARTPVARQVHFYGLEMMGRSLGHAHPIPDRPLDAALTYLATVDPDQARRFDARLRKTLATLAARRYSMSSGVASPYQDLSVRERDDFTVGISDVVSLFERRQVQWIEKSSAPEYERAYRSALNARALDADMRANGWWLGCWAVKHGNGCDPDQRDTSSARNLLWALEQEGTTGRVLFFAHNIHVRKGPTWDKEGRVAFTSLGQHLHAALGANLVVIGMFFGDTAGVTDADDIWYDGLTPVLSAAGRSPLVLNLRNLPAGPVASWWNRRIPGPSGPVLNPAESYDALIFFHKLTAWHAK